MSRSSPILSFLRRVAPSPGDTTDAELLRRFVGQRDEAAFAALMQRHGPMVLAVCRRLLRTEQDAEDALQATFLVLACKARAVGRPELLGNWLYGVAYRVALKARSAAAERRMKEQQAARVPAEEVTPAAVWADLRPVLDEEVHRLPDKFRAPFVLCYLEGKTNEEAARLMGCPKGTVMSRLATARERLRVRLTRRGIALSAGLLAAALAEGAASAVVPSLLMAPTAKAALAAATGQAVAGLVSARVASLTEGVVRAMFIAKARSVVGVLFVIGLLGAGAAFGISRTQATAPPPQQAEPAKAKDDPVAQERKKFVGTWKVVATETEGKTLRPVEDIDQDLITWEADGSWKQLSHDGQTVRGGGTSAIDPSKTPKTLDLVAMTGSDGDARSVKLAIYEFPDDNTLRICRSPSKTRKRPEKFATAPDSDYLLMTLERVRAASKDVLTLKDAVLVDVDPRQGTVTLVTGIKEDVEEESRRGDIDKERAKINRAVSDEGKKRKLTRLADVRVAKGASLTISSRHLPSVCNSVQRSLAELNTRTGLYASVELAVEDDQLVVKKLVVWW